MISSVQTIQTTLINAPDNVLGMVKGVSDLVLSNDTSKSSSSMSNSSSANGSMTSGKAGNGDSNVNSQRMRQLYQGHSAIVMPSGSIVTSTPKAQSVTTLDSKELIDRTVLNDDDMVSSIYLFIYFLIEFEKKI